MTVQDKLPTNRPAGPMPVHESGRDSPRRAGRTTGRSPLLAVCGRCGGAGVLRSLRGFCEACVGSVKLEFRTM